MFTSFTRAVAAGALLAGAANAGDHFILTQVRTLSLTRIDPMLTPGAPGPHAHVILGASNFGPNSGSPDVLDQAKCSSTLIGDDKSSYWSPQVYYNHGNGSYSAMLSSTRIYYFLKPLNGTQAVVPFPRGFRMLAGGKRDSRPETYPPRGELSYDQQQELDPRVNAIKWGCSAGAVQGQGNGGSLPGQRPYLPNDAPNGCGVLNAGVFFPSCSDGRLDSDDHFSHMRYPLDGPNGYKCPASHNTKFPTIFLENFYFPGANQPYRGANQDNWVLSNGDTLGLTYHADFINGWNQDTLTQTLQQCNTPNAPEANLEQCGPLAKSLSVDNADKCISEGQIADEPVGLVAPINALPGCNPIWPAEARTKPSCQANEVGIVQPSSRYTVPDFKISLPLAGGDGTSKVAAAPAGADPNAGYSSYSSNYSSSSYASTSSVYAATSTDASAAASTTSTSDALAAAQSESSTASALPTTSASYNPDAYGSAPSSASAASGSVTSSYAAASAEPSSYPSSESSSSNPGSQVPTNYPTSYAPGAQAPSGYPESQASTTYAAATGATSQASSSTSSAATSTAAPQRGNVGGPGKGHPGTCHRKGKGKKTHARREWQSRLLH